MRVILISGKAQHGKDTTAKIIKEELIKDNHKVLITHYGDLLKYICTNYFEWDGQKDEAGRQLLQYVGTDIIRKQNPTMWVDFVGTMLQYFHENWDYVIIPDCRFPNEIDRIKDFGLDSIHLRVVRPDFESPLTLDQQKHVSETALDGVEPDYYVYNSGSTEDLKINIKNFISEELKIQ